MNMEATPEKKGNSSKIVVIVALVLLIGADIFLLWQLFNQNKELNKRQTTLEQKDKKISELDGQIASLEKRIQELEAANKELEGVGVSKDEELETLRAQLATAKRMRSVVGSDPTKLRQLQKQLEEMSMKVNKKQADFDGLKNDNEKALRTLRDSLNEARAIAEKRSSEASVLSKKIKEGAALKADNIVASPLRVKSGGQSTKVDKAKKTDVVKVAFKIQQNLVADAGERTVYMRLLDPGKQLITSNKNETFMYEGENMPFTSRKTINYENKDTEVSLTVKKTTAWVKGRYVIEVYENGGLIGKSGFTLK